MRLSVTVLLLALPLTFAVGGCEQQASDQTSFGVLTSTDPPCIAPSGSAKQCFAAVSGQLDDVAVGDCVEVRHRPPAGDERGPILSIRAIPVPSSNGDC